MRATCPGLASRLGARSLPKTRRALRRTAKEIAREMAKATAAPLRCRAACRAARRPSHIRAQARRSSTRSRRAAASSTSRGAAAATGTWSTASSRRRAWGSGAPSSCGNNSLKSVPVGLRVACGSTWAGAAEPPAAGVASRAARTSLRPDRLSMGCGPCGLRRRAVGAGRRDGGEGLELVRGGCEETARASFRVLAGRRVDQFYDERREEPPGQPVGNGYLEVPL